jgi:hypothetical protein
MPSKKSSSSTAETVDPREEELREVEARLTTLFNILRGKHTKQSVAATMEAASARLNDKRSYFVKMGADVFEGTNHLQGLIHYAEALQLQIDIGRSNPVNEATRLLERKIQLMKELNGV